MDATSVAKSKIENAQRELRKVEKNEGRQWERRFFKCLDLNESTDDDSVYQVGKKIWKLLGVSIPDASSGAASPIIDSDKTGGVWRFDPESARNATPPYYKDSVQGVGLGVNSGPGEEAQQQ